MKLHLPLFKPRESFYSGKMILRVPLMSDNEMARERRRGQ